MCSSFNWTFMTNCSTHLLNNHTTFTGNIEANGSYRHFPANDGRHKTTVS